MNKNFFELSDCVKEAMTKNDMALLVGGVSSANNPDRPIRINKGTGCSCAS